jgi:hypothetical protein
LLLVAMAFFAAATAQPAATTPTIDEIVARSIEARGGLDKIRSIRSLRETGQITTGANRSGRVIRERKRPASMRIEFTVQGVTGVKVFDGRHAWRMSPLDGDLEPQLLPEGAEAEAAEEADIEGPLVGWKAKGHQLELVGHEMVGDHETYKVKITLKEGGVIYDFFDVESYLRLRSIGTGLVGGRPVPIEATFGDYKKTDGVLFPHRIEIAAAGRPQRLQVVVETIEVNPSISDSRFEMPVEAE